MRVITTDTSYIWHPANPALKIFKDVLLIVCLEGKAVTDQYECFVSPYKQIGMDIDQFGLEDQKYKALESVADDLNRLMDYHDEILFLTDGNPSSLYPFYVLKDRQQYNTLHLCTVSPWQIGGKRRMQAHKEMLSDLSKLTSILYIDSDVYLDDAAPEDTLEDVRQKMEKEYMALLPTVVNHIGRLDGRYYFDFSSNTYVAVEKGFDRIRRLKKHSVSGKIKVPLSRSLSELGVAILRDIYPDRDDKVKEEIESVPARIDGKQICEFLKRLRIKLAEANGIAYASEKCPSIGPCAGTCAKCDQEAAWLRDQLAAIAPENRVIPDFTLTEWEVDI